MQWQDINFYGGRVPHHLNPTNFSYEEENMTEKQCILCKEVKPFAGFDKAKRNTDGHDGRCKSCKKEQGMKRYRANKQRHNAQMAEWRRNNKGAINAFTAKRRAMKKQATPAWADLQYIKDLYSNAAEANAIFEAVGVSPKFQVDHIVPLQHDLVCGLHTEDNLQILTAEENQRKSNTFKVA